MTLYLILVQVQKRDYGPAKIYWESFSYERQPEIVKLLWKMQEPGVNVYEGNTALIMEYTCIHCTI